ncbi:major facilitator superfamily domain-containing protein [Colletotrichum navitas]|uniref:Major facilitator superfamily domain-containing protein n=1 Tax=Colletotrichum navitas TaxID=681940 RepID=A0AAD8PR50_9PEZI|nr:major facilitator superfamily domain-containing protein [Colletotrichum navitas]KAK1579166.1 major facilitator superfamily domain-containing protein [Colletotrichum navitas]
MDAKDNQNYRNAISLDYLHPAEPRTEADYRQDKQDLPPSTSASEPATMLNVPLDGAYSQGDPEPMDPKLAKMRKQARWALLAMAFFMGDVQEGLGPFLGVYLQDHNWAPGMRGSVVAMSHVATIIMSGPIGALIDATRYKRALVATFACTVGTCQGLNLLSTHPACVFTTQMVSAVAGASLIPLLVALTMGVCTEDPEGADADAAAVVPATGGKDKGKKKKNKHSFIALNGRNQASNHLGNMITAGAAGALGQKFGLPAVFYLVIACCACTMAIVWLIPEGAIDHAAARGRVPVDSETDDNNSQHHQDMQERGAAGKKGGFHLPGLGKNKKKKNADSSLMILVKNKPLAIVAVTVFLFHLGNACILYIYGQALVVAGEGDPAQTTGLTVIIAQATMTIMSVLTAWVADRSGYWYLVMLSYIVLPIRAVLAGKVIKYWAIWPVQILDGIAHGILSVATPGMVAMIMAGTGRINVAYGIAGNMTRQSGSAISHSLGGWMSEVKGYNFAIMLCGVFPAVGLIIWLATFRLLRPLVDIKKAPKE